MKKYLKTILSVIAVIGVSLVVGITGAWFTESREATGIIQMAGGVVLQYTNLTGDDPYYLIFDSSSSYIVSNNLPGDSIAIKNVSVAQTAESTDAVLRFKIQYGTRAGSTGVFTYYDDYADAGLSSGLAVSSLFRLNTTNNYYYYCTAAGASASAFTFSNMKTISTTAVKLFGDGTTASVTIAGSVNANQNISIKIIIEAVQANQAGFVGEGWGIA